MLEAEQQVVILLVLMVVHQVHLETLHLVVEEEVLNLQVQELVDLVVQVVVQEDILVEVTLLELVILAHPLILIIYHMVTLHLMVGEMMVEQTHILVARIMVVVEVVEHNTTECQAKTPIVFQLNTPCIHTQEMVVMV